MVDLIYLGKSPYITDDERKLAEYDTALLKQLLPNGEWNFFNVVATALYPTSGIFGELRQ
jgi:hypothetical protein